MRQRHSLKIPFDSKSPLTDYQCDVKRILQCHGARRHGVLRARSVAQTMASIVLGMPFSKMCGIAASWAVLLAVGGDCATLLKTTASALQIRTSSSILLPLPFKPSNMCHWRKVTNTYLRCGHTLRLPDERILCGNARCKFSDKHDPNCPACIDTCFQYGDRPKSYNPQIDWYCPKCAAYMTAGH